MILRQDMIIKNDWKRKRLLTYIKDKNAEKYQDLVKEKLESEDDFHL